MPDAAHNGFDSGTQMVSEGTVGLGDFPPLCTPQSGLVETQPGVGLLLVRGHRACLAQWTALTGRLQEAGQEGGLLCRVRAFDRVPVGAGHLLRLTVCSAGTREVVQAQTMFIGSASAQRRLNVRDAQGMQQGIGLLVDRGAVCDGSPQAGACLQAGSGFQQHLGVVSVGRCNVRMRHELNGIVWVARLAQVGGEPRHTLSVFCAVGRLQVVRRLRTGSAQFVSLFALQPLGDYPTVFHAHPRRYGVGRVGVILRFQCAHQAAHVRADALKLFGQVFRLQAIDVLPGMPLQIGRKQLRIVPLVGFPHHTMHPLQHRHQQVHASHPPNVGSQQRAVHALVARLARKGMDVSVSPLREGLVKEIDAGFLHIAAETFAEGVQGAQVNIPRAQLTYPMA